MAGGCEPSYSPRLGVDGFVHYTAGQVRIREGLLVVLQVVFIFEIGLDVGHEKPNYGVFSESVMVDDGDFWDVGGFGGEDLEQHD